MSKELCLKYMEGLEGDFNNRTLARKIVKENPDHFPNQDVKDIENVRNRIRYIRGANGKYHKQWQVEEYVREEKKPSEYMAQFMEKGEKVSKSVWTLPEEHKKVLLMGDLHMPYHYMPAIEVCLDYALSQDVDCIYLNGDIIDFYKISRWSKDPSRRNIQEELDIVHAFLNGLSGFGLPIYYKMGNHEDRWNRYLLDNAPELYSINAIQLDKVLKLDELDIELIESRQRAQFGSLNVIHGHEFGQSFFNPVNPARGLFLRAKTSTIAGHNHQTSSHHENNLNGKQTACFSLGCLCDLEPEYRPYAFTKWNHGFAIVEVDDREFAVSNKRIVHGRVV